MFKIGSKLLSLTFLLLMYSCSQEEKVETIKEEQLPEFNKKDFRSISVADSITLLLPNYLTKLSESNGELARYNSLVKELHISIYLRHDSLTQELFDLKGLNEVESKFKFNFTTERKVKQEHTTVNGRNTISSEYEGKVDGYPFDKIQLLKWYQLNEETLLIDIWCRSDQFSELENDIRVIQRSVK